MHDSAYPTAFRQSCIPTVDLVSDPLTQLSTPRWGAEPGLESVASVLWYPLLGTVFQTTSIKFVALVFSRAASKLNYSVDAMPCHGRTTDGIALLVDS